MARTKDFDEKEVLTKAMHLFWRNGYHATSMQDLVDGLGISRSSLYDTYGDKHTLYLRALETYQETSGGQLCDIISNAVSAKNAIETLLQFIISGLLSDTEHKGCFLVNAEVEVAGQDEKVNEIICQNDQFLERAFLKAIKNGQKAGEISTKKDALALARFMMNTVKGLRVSARATADKSLFRDIVRTALSVLD